MAASPMLLLLVGFCLLLQPIAGQQHFSFPNFYSVSNLEATGDAHQKNGTGEFWLTDYNYGSHGAFRYLEPIRLCNTSSGYTASFLTNFTFKIDKADQSKVNADGLAFTIAPGKLATSNATFGRWLGAFSSVTNGKDSNQIVAVEFDTYSNSPPDYPEFNDIDDNHVGLDLHRIRSANQSSLNPAGVTLGSGQVVTAKVDYNAQEQRLRVYVSYDPQSLTTNPVLDHTFKLCAYVQDESFVGFSAGTGTANLDYHKILSWNFAVYDPDASITRPIPISHSKAGPSRGLLAGFVVPAVFFTSFLVMLLPPGDMFS